MKKTMPRTPFSTHLSRSARDLELRIRNIMSGPKKRPPIPFLVLMFAVCIFCGNIVSCQVAETPPPDGSNPDTSQTAPDLGVQLNTLALNYLQDRSAASAYLAADAPESPQEWDWRLDSAVLLGTETVDGDHLGLCQLDMSQYSQRADKLEWLEAYPTYLLLRLDGDGSPTGIVSEVHTYTEDMSPQDAIRQEAWGLYDLEVCLFRDGYSTPIGPANWVDSMFSELEPEIIVHEGWEPIYQPGDYWDEWSVEGVTAVRYCNAELSSFHLNNLKATRSDMYTPRGIRVGSTREEVRTAYPEIHDEPYWGDIDSDYLWYGDKDEFGPTLLFNFADDKVDSIVLSYILD